MGNNSALLESADGKESLLLDCGYLTPLRLKEMGRLQDIRHIAITHVHMDHAGGLEFLADMHQFVYRQHPHLYFPNAMYEELWNGCLRGGLEATQDEDGRPLKAPLQMYFQVHTLNDGEVVAVPGLPVLTPRPTLHIPDKPAFGYFLGEDIYFSGDTQEPPPLAGPTGKPLRLIFQDCQLVQHRSDVHISLQELHTMLPAEVRAITWLMHYSEGWEHVDPLALGFAGFVKPMQKFVFPLEVSVPLPERAAS
jgi:ribonuclease BN (tRNA processing enzyme)